MTSTTKVISRKEVALHKSEDDMWMVIRGAVYNVTAFGDEHPGGVDTLLDVAGDDATDEYDSVGHSDSANELLKKYQVGVVAADDKHVSTKSKNAASGSITTIVVISTLLALVAFLILRE